MRRGVLGVSDVVMLHHTDGELEDTTDFRKEIVRQIRLLKPDVVLCPEPYRRNLAWHRDHRITGQVTLDAVFPAARDHLNFVELWRDEGLEPHKTAMVLFWGAELADTYVDISDSFDTKVEAVMAHKSQMRDRSLKRSGDSSRNGPGMPGPLLPSNCRWPSPSGGSTFGSSPLNPVTTASLRGFPA